MPIERAEPETPDADTPMSPEDLQADALAALETIAASLFTLASLALTIAAKSGQLTPEDADKLARMMADTAGEDLSDDIHTGFENAPTPTPTRRR